MYPTSFTFCLIGGLNTQEDGENLLGYSLYSSALADMLSGKYYTGYFFAPTTVNYCSDYKP